ncbi:MAG: fluoride efflux transporter CrcB [Candidatus Omnitrophica bacterium CG12_big_fil_rev_8_21_14_0_65_50_5]|nr:MAG: fluoride efflux transporter CrcB [Candidatus Omnitrophica bacterium CG12_big_fil_rev_8_21_14_0_65_50_5]
MIKWIYFGLASMAGGFSRYFLTGFMHQIFGASFPYGTLIVNLTGCFLIGLFAALADEKFLLSPQMRLILMVGFCGAFTTFSTFMLETSNLIRDGETLRAFFNILISVLIGFFVFRTGVLFGKII